MRRPPTRSCVACRQSRDKRDLLRVVRTPEGDVRIDSTGRLNGRGAYVDRDPACIDSAIDRRLLAHALEADVPTTLRSELREAASAHKLTTTGGTLGQE